MFQKNQDLDKLINSSLPVKAENSKEDLEIHTIPDKFKKPTYQKSNSGVKKFWWIGAVVILLAMIAGGAYFFVTKYGPGQPDVKPIVEENQPVQNEPVKLEVEKSDFISAKQTLTGRIEDETGMMLSQMKLILPEGSMSQDFEIEIAPQEVSQENVDSKYHIIGGIYKIEVGDEIINLSQPAELVLYYAKDLVDQNLEKYISIGYRLDGSDWREIKSQVDSERFMVTADQVDKLQPEYALIVAADIYKQAIVEKGVASMINIEISDTSDQDEDGLTDIEEGLFTTNLANKDTDQDGYDDRTEILNLYSPKQGPGDFLLIETNLVKEYQSPAGYQVLIPTGFVATAMSGDQNSGNVMFATNRGEFFQITVQDNPDLVSVKDWYLLQMPSLTYNQVKTQVINDLEAVVGYDSTSVYFGVGDKIYVLSYAMLDGETEIAYETTFEMFVKSFKMIK